MSFLVNHPLLLLALYVLVIVGLIVCFHKLIYKEEPKRTIEVVEHVSAWDSLPEETPWHPDPAEAHLGKTHIGR